MMLDQALADFAGREDDLRHLTRYSLYPVMFYRTNLYTHSQRVAAIVRAINPTAQQIFDEQYDPVKAEALALVHDDAEIFFGDYQSGNKSKMSPAQLAEIEHQERAAIDQLIARFPQSIAGYNYGDLLKEPLITRHSKRKS